MRKNRSILKRNQRKKKAALDLDITSLLDILVILLVFLLKSYNTGVILNVAEGINLPKSVSQSPNEQGIVVQVSPNKIWVDEAIVLDSGELPPKIYDQGGRRIIPLYNALMKKREKIELLSQRAKEAADFSGKVNLVIDKSLKYSYLKKLMYTCAEAGFKEYNFIVLGEET